MTTDIIIAKGSFSVTIPTIDITEEYKNQMTPKPFPTTKQKQEIGPKTVKVMDMLQITNTIKVRGILTTSTDRNNLISIFNGARVSGSPCTITYDTHPNTPLSMFMENLTIIENSRDKLTANDYKYEVQITLIEGLSM